MDGGRRAGPVRRRAHRKCAHEPVHAPRPRAYDHCGAGTTDRLHAEELATGRAQGDIRFRATARSSDFTVGAVDQVHAAAAAYYPAGRA